MASSNPATEPPTLLFDIGSSTIRAGLSTDPKPRFEYSTAYPVDDPNYPFDQPLPKDTKIEYCIKNGEVVNKERLDLFFATIFNDFFPDEENEPEELRIIITTLPYPSKDHIMYIANSCFDLLSASQILMKTPAQYTAMQSPMSTVLCVDIGHDVTHVVPITDGYVVSKAVTRSFAAGSALDLFTTGYQMGLETVETWGQVEEAREMKHKYGKVALNLDEELNDVDDDMIIYGATVGELLFRPELFEAAVPGDNEPDERISTLMEMPSIQSLISTAIEKCDNQCRTSLWNNIIVTGGTSKLPGFVERLQEELVKKAPALITPKVKLADDQIHSAWLGEATCCKFADTEPWLNAEEYDETDPECVYKKFFAYGYVDPNENK